MVAVAAWIFKTPEQTEMKMEGLLQSARRFVRLIASSPRTRLLVTTLFSVILAIVSGVYATQIVPDGKIAWLKLTSVSSFWPLVIVILIWIAIQLGFLGYDEAVERFSDDGYCRAFIRYTNLNAYAQTVKDNPANTRDARSLLNELEIRIR